MSSSGLHRPIALYSKIGPSISVAGNFSDDPGFAVQYPPDLVNTLLILSRTYLLKEVSNALLLRGPIQVNGPTHIHFVIPPFGTAESSYKNLIDTGEIR